MNFNRFITRPVLSTVISIFIVILGIIGLIQLPIEQYPNLAPPTVQVSTAYAGADAQTVLNSVIIPLEEQINGVEGMTYMTSTATNSGGASTSRRAPTPTWPLSTCRIEYSKPKPFSPQTSSVSA